MSTPYAVAYLRQSTKTAADFFAKDLKALPEAALTACPGGCARTPLDITAECTMINGYIVTALTGGSAARLSDDEKKAHFARFDTLDNALPLFQAEADRLLAAIDAVDDDRWGEMTAHPFGHQDTLYSVASLPAIHMMYHDGQLTYNQTLHDDPVNHWF